MAKPDSQANFFLRYLSTAPVLAIVATSIAVSTWALFNYVFPDLLFHPMP
ncbi:MAG: PsaJ protein [Tildeniella nuda ZEHNDER 1965/U140]|nr:PsaJ protein [Tildeniella nuda ZEHNDER 1965/U140]